MGSLYGSLVSIFAHNGMCVLRDLATTQGSTSRLSTRGILALSRMWGLSLAIASPMAMAEVPMQAEYSKLIQSRSMLQATGADLFGDRVNLFTGALEFVQEDVSLPGNSALPVAVGRRFVEGHGGEWDVTMGHFGDWDLEIPRVHGVFSTARGWTVNVSGTISSQRCSHFGAPPTAPADSTGPSSSFAPEEYWHGTFLYLPESGDHEILKRSATNALQPGDGKGSYPLVTKADAAISCIPINTQSSNEGFRVRTPDGRVYTFDHLVSRDYPTVLKNFPNAVTTSGFGSGTQSAVVPVEYLLQRHEFWMLPTEISDRYGNKVIYEWNASVPWQLDQIRGQSTGEPDRLLTFEYYAGTGGSSPPRVQYVYADELGGAAGRRRWEYVYDSLGRLSQVVLPDASTWQFSLTSLLSADIGDGGNCDVVASNGLVATGSMIHPSGATGAFTTETIVRTRTWVPWKCISTNPFEPGYSVAVWPYKYATRALTAKKVTGIGLPGGGLNWTYAYSSDPACWGSNGSYPPNDTSFPNVPAGSVACVVGVSETVKTAVGDPSGAITRYTYGNRFRVNEGQLQKIEVLGSASRTTTMSYAAPSDYPWPNPIGSSQQLRGDSYLGTVHTPMIDRVIAQDGVNFSLEVDDFDNRARPIEQTRESTLAATLAPMSRTEVTTYLDLPAIWVLGLSDTVSIGADTVSDNDYYSATGNLQSSRQFGSNQQTFEYHPNGMLNKHTDPRSNVTTYTNYKRGVPRSITYADSTTESAVVNDYGLLTSVTDEVSAVTSYEYDLVGRVKKITQPTGDTVAWSPTNITYAKVAGAEYGFPANHWKRSEITGAFHRDTFYDALWRPILEREYDNTNPGGQGLQRFTRRGYDHAGRPAFVSYPETTGSLTAPTSGTSWSYDALGRLKATSQNSELGTLSTTITYLTGHKKRITDPLLRVTDFTFQAFDEPSEDRPVKIDQPEDAHTEIKRNIFGNATEIKRKNTSGSVSATRSYVYDAYQRLCKSIDPESGATVRDYNADGSLFWIAEGFSLPSTTSCDQMLTVGSRVFYTYDPRNRPQLINYPSDTSDVSMTYWPDGALHTTTTEGATWTYGYNKRRLLETESLAFDGQQFLLDWSYNANGARSQLMYPDDAIVAYQPNVFGEATQVGGYVSGIKYHPNRAIDAFTYGNGIQHTLTQNDRDLPLRSKDGSVVEYEYQYDKNSNVTKITDHAQSGTETRTMTYDQLNRLSTVSAPGIWGSADYTYDQLDNMKTSQVGTRSYTHAIQSTTNRLTSISGTGPTISYGYDPRGNATQRGAQAFTYDYANRLQSATNVESYDYDGHGRRVLIQKAGGAKAYQVYSRDGELLFGYDVASGKSTNYVHLSGSLVARSETLPGSAGPGVPANLRASPNPSMNGMFAVAWDAVQGAVSYVLEETAPAGGVSTVYAGSQLSWATAGRSPGTYQYRVKACDGACSAWSATITVTVIGGVPSISVAPNPSTNGSYTVSWTAVVGATSYALEELPPGGNWYSVSTGSAGLSWSITGRPNGSYQYRVHACTVSGCGGYSQTITEVVQTTPPPDIPVMNPPTPNPSTNGAYTVSWSAESGATSYRLEERVGSGGWAAVQSSGNTSMSFTGSTNGSYSYRVQACNSACSGYSNVVTEVVNIVNPPGAPGNITSDDNPSQDGSFTLTWPSVATATSYVLERRTVGGSWTHVITQAGRTWGTSGEPNGSHGFRVKACNTVCGLYSNSYTQIVQNGPPMPTVTATPNPSTGPIHVSWTSSQGATSYELQERLNTGSWPPPGGGTTLTQTSVDLLRGDGSYEFRVRACIAADRLYCSDYSNVAAVIVQQSTIPPAPASISGPPIGCMASPRTYTISWAASAGATYYEVHDENDAPSGNPGHVDQIVTVSAPTTSKTFMHSAAPGMGGSSIYSYEVRACSANGCSPYRGTVEVCVGIPLMINGSSSTTTYVHTDALHSPVAETNETGAVTKRFRYEPYGAPTTGSYEQGPGYTGHVTDASTGLSYMQQRYYDPMIGRMLSRDPVTAFSSGDMRNFNVYAYANNNPYRFTDPDGRNALSVLDWYDFGKDVGGLIVTEIVATAAFVSGNDAVLNMALDDMSAGAFDAAASTAGIISPKPGTGRDIKAVANVVEKTASGKRVGDFTSAQKNAAKAENAAANGGQMTCADCGKAVASIKNEKGVPTPSNQAQVHHDPAIKDGGGKDSKAVVVCPDCHKDRHSQ